MKVIQGRFRTAFLIFFISHIPITILIDSQGALSPFFPQLLVNVVAWYSDVFGDVLMRRAPSSDIVWFSSLIYCELIFQLPFFFVATNMLISYPSNATSQTPMHYPGWFKTACLIYGSHVSTTLVPILATFITSEDMSTIQKSMTLAGKYFY
jgi:uncharacterized membrane protein YhdT